MTMKLLIAAVFIPGALIAAPAKPSKKFSRTQVTTQLGMASMSIPLGDFSDPGINIGISYYFLPKLTLNASYFLAVSTTGSTNFNGFGVLGKYYFWNTETTTELNHGGTKVTSFDKYFAYGTVGFYDRDIRTSQLTVSYSGFGLGLGAGMKLNAKNSIGVEVLRANMENPTGAASQAGGSFSYFSIFHSYLF